MAFTTANLQIVQCDVPGCGTFRYFIGPKELQGTGWLQVERLGDQGASARQYICPEHAHLLQLDVKNFKTPVMRFTDESALQAFIDKGAGTYRKQLDSGDVVHTTQNLLSEGENKK